MLTMMQDGDRRVMSKLGRKATAKLSRKWLYRIWYRGYSGRIHKLSGKYRWWNGHFIHTADGTSWGLPPAIARNIVKIKKARRIRKSEL